KRESHRCSVLEDPLEYLPRAPIQGIQKGHAIYDPQHPSNKLYMVVLGRLKIVNTAYDGSHIVAQIVSAEALFGASALIPNSPQNQTATALENSTVMSWTAEDIEEKIESEPRLGLALMEYMARDCIE